MPNLLVTDYITQVSNTSLRIEVHVSDGNSLNKGVQYMFRITYSTNGWVKVSCLDRTVENPVTYHAVWEDALPMKNINIQNVFDLGYLYTLTKEAHKEKEKENC